MSIATHEEAAKRLESDNDLRWCFLRSLIDGDVGKMFHCIEKGADVAEMDSHIGTGVHYAAAHGQWQCVLALLQLQSDLPFAINQPNLYGHTTLHLAARRAHVDVCLGLIARGGNLDILNSFGLAPTDLFGDQLHGDEALTATQKDEAVAELRAAQGAYELQRKRLDNWIRRLPFITVLAEHAYRPLQHRALAIALAAASLDPAASIQPIALTTSQQRHAYLLGRVFSCEGIVRLLVALL